MVKTNEAGFTIIEVIVALVTVSLFVVGIGNLFAQITNTQHDSELLSSATRAGQSEIESLRNSDYTALTAGTNIDFSSSLPSDLPDNSTGIVVVTQPSTDIRRVDVTITYPISHGTHKVELTSLIGIIGIGK
ncbi:MAG TPA: prepilin-type N-terminal cleavage/methylation domain-containing protein [Candidatus Saccharimonadales bacterium]|nr:prepilin-type N-terminal cleavage/methylation domain-containing protein [Candidatus Saccharimonadales bacterium]